MTRTPWVVGVSGASGTPYAKAVLTGLLFGTAPAWLAAHVNPIDALRGANRSQGKKCRESDQNR